VRTLGLLLFLALPLSAATFQTDDGVTLYYEIVGKGKPVVLLSGGPGFSPDYLRPIADALGDRYAFVLFHQRGTGRSLLTTYDTTTLELKKLVADLEGLRKTLKARKLTIVGHSFGGILSMMYAAQHPGRIRALALIDSGGPTLAGVPKFTANLMARTSDEDNAKVREWSAPDRLAANRKKAILEITKARSAAYFADRSKTALLTDPMTEESFNDAMFYPVTGQLMAGLDLREGLRKLKAPVVVIHGRQDPLETAQEVHDALAGSRLEIVENAGHFPWLEQPKTIYGLLDGFLRSRVQ